MKGIVSFADGTGNYAKALMRLELSLKQVNFDGVFRGYNDYGHLKSPLHKGHANAVPYAFKPCAIEKFKEEYPEVRYLLWCDSVLYATKNINPIFDQIKKDGYIFFDNIGYSIGDYTSDYCLDHFNMSRDEAFNSKMIMACLMGFDLQNADAIQFLKLYSEAYKEGAYHGPWTNEFLQASNDMRVKGHRHDQSVASILIKQMNLKIMHAQSTYFAYTSHKGIVNIADSVCMWSEGI